MTRPAAGHPLTDVLHLDLDGFFASVELLDNPELRGLPVIVGGISERGVVVSASYEARAFGVHSAMPTVVARRCCPRAMFITPRHDRYLAMNRQLLRLIEQVTPDYEPIALDEAYLDLSGTHRLFGGSVDVASRLRRRVLEELGLACSVGIGRSKLVAKLASRAAKPSARLVGNPPGPLITEGRGIVLVSPEDEPHFLASHTLRAFPGIGPKTEERLSSLGISTVNDAILIGRPRLCALLGEHQGNLISDAVLGIDQRRVESRRESRSIGRETTFERDLFDPDELVRRLDALCESVARRAKTQRLVGRTVTLKIRYRTHETISKSTTPKRPLASAAALRRYATELCGEVEAARGVRLLGIQLSNLVSGVLSDAEQLELFSEERESKDTPRLAELEVVTEAVRRRFGTRALGHLDVDDARSPL